MAMLFQKVDGVDVASDARRDGFDFLAGVWTVKHRRLKERLASSRDWESFDGLCECRPIIGGFGNVDDNWIDLPGGAYRAATLRLFDAATGLWSIWWADPRSGGLDVPVKGRFDRGIGTFFSDDVHQGRAVRVRFTWSETDGSTPKWAQAFSADRGETWETNWEMTFHRSA